ncbi:beta-ketoacyl-ACP synthase II [Chryseobacterium arthrosphaerae]|uniref:3-oxoacyl-[acyl-carrier-protein] synthase 2 n=1 Tax=Chryseobacterium arthrosphaerae TaxID=651561 RepID=A0A1B8ZIP2_9FLAO|nr:beta-ketoacyl-ACP synthase II [Chryseobacterium arthrosphaerae]MDG4651789.1 beta-ketoacyl-ACP synthase II [Chryseobacterium arthrosphaerae]OCA71472.1 beta-ketoacyl-[acyl-carrier-protein] synthase II [Chryseobacterium arthrosphaerae]UEQ75370.1 beta-ketoacyl-ACP synthase II [Chryseobacterium arthrosphaerae]WES96668.1 beta-ketoacyl-ACP synthase II [Chryseobacterium arthrosphaerae]
MKRVVITGLGAVTPLGNNVEDFWQNSIKGTSGAGLITHFDTEKFKVHFACEVKNFDPKVYLNHNEIKRSDLFTQYAMYASAEAIQDSGLELENMDPFDTGVIWGTGQGGMWTFEKEVMDFAQGDGTPRFNPFFVPKFIANMASGMISMKYGLQGINYTTVSACATGNTALMDAFNYIRLGKAKVIISGGSEAAITPASIGGFSIMKAMSTRNDDFATASRPYDAERDGFVMGEGAGALVLEEYEHAVARGAKIYAELAGAAMTADAYHMTAPHPEGAGAIKAMQLAVKEAGANMEDIDYINPHATSTPLGDLIELKAINNAFKGSKNLDISATKSMTGHLLGAAGAVEAILSIKAIQNSIIPPTINLHSIDESIPKDINIVFGEAKEKEINFALSNAFGFGGHNATLVFKKFR